MGHRHPLEPLGDRNLTPSDSNEQYTPGPPPKVPNPGPQPGVDFTPYDPYDPAQNQTPGPDTSFNPHPGPTMGLPHANDEPNLPEGPPEYPDEPDDPEDFKGGRDIDVEPPEIIMREGGGGSSDLDDLHRAQVMEDSDKPGDQRRG